MPGEIELLGKSPQATMATMDSEVVGNQCCPDLLDAPSTIISIFIDSAAPALSYRLQEDMH
jgi:hypothetical protein